MKKILLSVIVVLSLSGMAHAADGDMVINGNLGVGTTTPTQKVDVIGVVKANGYYSGNTPGATRLLQINAPCSNWGSYPASPFNGCGCYLNIVGGLIVGMVGDYSGCTD